MQAEGDTLLEWCTSSQMQETSKIQNVVGLGSLNLTGRLLGFVEPESTLNQSPTSGRVFQYFLSFIGLWPECIYSYLYTCNPNFQIVKQIDSCESNFETNNVNLRIRVCIFSSLFSKIATQITKSLTGLTTYEAKALQVNTMTLV